jgi:TetR/AcrR family transcriptional regulator, transcriptional repressor for nem operon
MDTAQRVLEVAATLVQTRGFNGFSYADVAAELSITKASLHYHFSTKAELGRVLVERYAQGFALALEAIDRDAADELDKLRRYAAVYDGVLQQGKMCLCGMLAAEYGTLPEPMQQALTRFFDLNEAWLAGVLERGRRRGALAYAGAPREVARLLVGSLEGAMMLARSYGEPARFRAVAQRLLAEMKPAPMARPAAAKVASGRGRAAA